MKTLSSLLTTLLLLAAQPASAMEPVTFPFRDVPATAWFHPAVSAFYTETHQIRRDGDFDPAAPALRAELVKLVVRQHYSLNQRTPKTPFFDDVATNSWYFADFQKAALADWTRGKGECYGTHPCYVYPMSWMTRAEAAAFIVHAFGYEAQTNSANEFTDYTDGQWYSNAVQAAVDHCILRGDTQGNTIRPLGTVNRAEMTIMVYRALQGLQSNSCPSTQSGAARTSIKPDRISLKRRTRSRSQ